VAALPADGNKVALTHLCDLYALSVIEDDRAWWMEHGRLSSQRAKEITRTVGQLCRRLRPVAVDLVDAFGVPAEMLRAEMLD
jgi:acyl-CoA oxidase